MSSAFNLAAFEAAFPPLGAVGRAIAPGRYAVPSNNPYGAAAPVVAPPGVSQHITVLNMSGERATGTWSTEQEKSHFTIEDGHILNIHRSGVLPIRDIEILTTGSQPVYSNARIMPESTIAIVLNRGGGYSPLAPIGGGNNDNGGGGGNNDNRPVDPRNGGNVPSSNGGNVPPSNGGDVPSSRSVGNSYMAPAASNGSLSYSPFGWRV
jgi:hypothetical protein